jgi:2-haloacid dehalogenase
MRYQWLLFDADGTLFDYDRAEAAALRHTFDQTGLTFEPGYGEMYRQINKSIWLEFEQGQISQERLRIKRFELLFEALGIDLDSAAFSARYLANLARGTCLIDGAEEVVKLLHGRLCMAIVTNGLKEVQRPRLDRSAIGDYFAAIVISEEVGAAKPDPRFFDATFDRIGHPKKEDVLMVGDSLTSDIKGGNNYGIDTCWFNPTFKSREMDVKARYVIGQLQELLDLVGAT